MEYVTHIFINAMTMIDTSTKLVEIKSQETKTALEAAAILRDTWLIRYPRPSRCIPDNGSEFKGEFVDMLNGYGVENICTTTRNPESNVLIERIHRI